MELRPTAQLPPETHLPWVGKPVRYPGLHDTDAVGGWFFLFLPCGAGMGWWLAGCFSVSFIEISFTHSEITHRKDIIRRVMTHVLSHVTATAMMVQSVSSTPKGFLRAFLCP